MRLLRVGMIAVAAILATMLLLFVKYDARSSKAEVQPSLREEVDLTITLVKIGQTSNERSVAAMLLCEITRGDAAKQVDDQSLDSIVALLDSSDESVRYWVALCLGNFGHRAKAAVPKLLKILDQMDCNRAALTSAAAIRPALKRIGEEVPPSKCEWRRESVR